MFSNRNSTTNSIIRCYSSFIMAALYLTAGLLFLFSDMLVQIFPVYRQGVGAVLIAYSGFRIYSAIKLIKRLRKD